MKSNGKKRTGEKGVAFLLVAISLATLMAMAGFAIDAGQMYVTKQKAQAAADAGAQAGIMDMYRGIDDGTASAKAYAQQNGFLASEVVVGHPDCSTLAWCNGHVTLSGIDNPNLIQVTVTRVVNTTLLRVLGVDASTVTAVGTAAISIEPEPVPIIVLHPTLSGSFSKNGSNKITICGGPTRSIQVNSSSTTSLNISGVSGTVDLSHAGPLDTAGDCTAGTGADFANVGLQNPYPGTLLLGTKPGRYESPASAIQDPLLSVAAPAQPAPANAPLLVCGPKGTLAPLICPVAQHNCPLTLKSNETCALYSPGYYPGGIDIKGNVFAQFRSGIYWINLGGFQLESNSIVRMAQGADASDPTGVTTWPIGTTTAQMLVYNSGTGIFSISGNSGAFGSSNFPTADCPNGGNCLVGSPSGPGSTYSGILFFQNRATATTLNHSLQGGGGLTIQGTVYLTHTAASIQSDGKYQSLSLQGNSGGTTKVQGEIITDVLSLGGTADITMNLISTKTFQVRQVALVH